MTFLPLAGPLNIASRCDCSMGYEVSGCRATQNFPINSTVPCMIQEGVNGCKRYKLIRAHKDHQRSTATGLNMALCRLNILACCSC